MTQYMRIPSEEPESDVPAPAYHEDQQVASSSRTTELPEHDAGKNSEEGEQFVMLPPPYGDNNDLPTYEEVERIKRDEEDRDNENPYSALLNGAVTANLFNSELEVGSDSIFLLTFLIALMFSWVGFMLTFCVSNSLAGRYGAISGFGLSLIKWTVLVSHSQYAGEQTTYWFNAWVSWLLIMSGGMIFIRGIYLYVRAKQRAHSSLDNQSNEESGEERPTARQFSLFYFY
ncbi:NEDD4 family-interacting protein 2-like [Convolutriloba macropyga]|uniref:NEDD4 family-interacting protein 2-like n=1 Tax=Convolutriloba macropyga TaxID=536237 RepID=UPI003F521BD1